MKKLSVLVVSLGLLAGCATIIEGQTQPLTVLTPGADDARCIVHNKDMRYTIRSGESRQIMKSNKDLIVDCAAPGNRQRTVIVDSQLEPAAAANVTNGVVPGTTYDHFSKALYAYPEIITVDFTNVQASAYPLPDYMRPEVRNVYSGELENFGPNEEAVPSDRYRTPSVIKKRTGDSDLTGNPFGSGAGSATAKPSLIPVTEK